MLAIFILCEVLIGNLKEDCGEISKVLDPSYFHPWPDN